MPVAVALRTDYETVDFPSIPKPLVGGRIIDPNFGAEILRVTGHREHSYSVRNANVFNHNSTKFWFEDERHQKHVMSLDPFSLEASPLLRESFSEGTFTLPGDVEFAHGVDGLFHLFEGRLDFYSFGLDVLEVTRAFDFSPLLGFAPTWESLEVDDRGGIFAATFSKTGQGGGSTVIIFDAARGVRMLDTRTGAVTGDYGEIGTTQAPRFNVDAIRISRDGGTLVVMSAYTKFFWDIETLDISTVVHGVNNVDSGGLGAVGNSLWINEHEGTFYHRWLDSPGEPFVFASAPGFLHAELSWNNVKWGDMEPVFAVTQSPLPHSACWNNEVISISVNGEVHRHCHTHSTRAIGAVSQDGKFFLFSSDWGTETSDIYIARI